jgi:hypothetical protein
VPKLSLQEPGLSVEYRNQPVAEARFGFAEPFSVAPVLVSALKGSVVTLGGPAVVNERTVPNPVPDVLEAMAQ